jgi:serine/threonine protein kinase
MEDLNDEDCVPTIREFVRANKDIEMNCYIRRGCNGEVYFGKRKKMGDDVVLKFYWSHPNYDASEEAVILQKIEHKNILKIYDLKFLPPNYAYFLTPKISGGDLQGIIDSRNISSKEALEIVAGILLGLTELHSAHQLVHRDLKPGNILIDLTENKPIIADLGAVKKIDDANGHVTASKSTYLYLPPEAIMRNEYYYQSDIYQVGLILFQLLNGFFPVNEPLKWLTKREEKQYDQIINQSEKDIKFDEIIADKIVKGKLVDNATLPYYVDANFKKVLNIALNPKHGSRYKNTSLFLKDIHHLLRVNPEYIRQPDCLYVKHESGKQYKIYVDRKGNSVIEKCISNNNWRKDNGHNGTIEGVLKIARQK